MILLRNRLYSVLRTIHPQVYFHEAPKTASFPYIVFDLPNSTVNEEQELLMLDVDIWERSDDTETLENLCEQAWRRLHKYSVSDSMVQFTINRMTRGTLLDDDPRIRRRKMTFTVRYFDKNLYNPSATEGDDWQFYSELTWEQLMD